jgi:elongation factor Ts
MVVTSENVKLLREKTGAGMMDCKKALSECSGDFEKAVDYLRQKGLAAAEKKQARIASEGLVGSYIHNGRIGVLVEVNCETDFVARNEFFQQFVKDVALHIAATSPKFLKSEEMDDAFKEREAKIFEGQLRDQGKPEAMIPKIVEGKLAKLSQDVCLYEQAFIKDPDKTIKMLMNELTLKLGEKVEVRRFVIFHLGEGVEKKKDDFAEEVSKMTHKS